MIKKIKDQITRLTSINIIENGFNPLSSIKGYFSLTEEQRQFLYLRSKANFSSVDLPLMCQDSIEKVKKAAFEIYGEKWNYYSNALRKEAVLGFYHCIQNLKVNFSTIRYLEIGSCQGISMSLIGTLTRALGCESRLTSVEPYFKMGYKEGEGAPLFSLAGSHESFAIKVDKETKRSAFELYQNLQLDVQLIEKESKAGLLQLIENKNNFNLIYIDGAHEGLHPLIDFSLSTLLIENGGIIILDDHHWRDVKPIKELAELHCEKIYENWKLAAYKIKRTIKQ